MAAHVGDDIILNFLNLKRVVFKDEVNEKLLESVVCFET